MNILPVSSSPSKCNQFRSLQVSSFAQVTANKPEQNKMISEWPYTISLEFAWTGTSHWSISHTNKMRYTSKQILKSVHALTNIERYIITIFFFYLNFKSHSSHSTCSVKEVYYVKIHCMFCIEINWIELIYWLIFI